MKFHWLLNFECVSLDETEEEGEEAEKTDRCRYTWIKVQAEPTKSLGHPLHAFIVPLGYKSRYVRFVYCDGLICVCFCVNKSFE